MQKLLIASFASFALAACGGGDSQAAAPNIIRLSAIPDFNKGTLTETCNRLAAYLSKATGVEVRYDASNDYSASVNGLVANKLDLVWYGGVTSVEADEATGGKVSFVATRDIDLKFKTYFIANQQAVAAGKVKPVQRLEDLKPMLQDLTFTFGDKKSTSGHIMPRHFLVQAGIDPEKDFKSPASYRVSGGHAATLASVMSGEVDLGALNYSYYDKAKPEDQAKAPLVYTTPLYVDYCFLAHERLGGELIGKIRSALTRLDPANPEHAQILKDWGAGSFVPAERKDWDGIRAVLKALPKGFLNQ